MSSKKKVSKKHRKKRRKHPPRNILKPHKSESKFYNWPTLRVSKIANKNDQLGVRAVGLLPKNSWLVYWGKEISVDRFQKLVAWSRDPNKDDAKEKYVTYVADSGRKDILINAHPKFCTYKHVGGRGKWIGGLVNEPTTGERANCVLVKRKIDGQFWPVLITVKDIADGELLVYYGGDYERDYPIGKKAKWPWWL